MIFEMIAPFITPAILIFGVINFIIFQWSRYETKKLENIVFPQGDRRYGNSYAEVTEDDLKVLSKASNSAMFTYTLFANCSAIFPLLGIFGTVCSLMRLAGTDNMLDNFSIALDTTAYGLVCAMIFKLLDSLISSKLDRALDGADYQIHEHDKEKRNAYAATEAGHRH